MLYSDVQERLFVGQTKTIVDYLPTLRKVFAILQLRQLIESSRLVQYFG